MHSTFEHIPFLVTLAISVVFQLVAAFLSLRLMRITGRRVAWGIVTAALLLMAIRRMVPLFRLLFTETAPTPDAIGEAIALLISIGLAAAMAAIAPMFREGLHMERTLREREQHSEALLMLSRSLEGIGTYQELVNAALRPVEQILGYHRLWVYLFEPGRDYASLLMAGGEDFGADISRLPIKGDQMMEEIAAHPAFVLVEDARTDPRVNHEIVARLGNRSIVNVPIVLFDRYLGSVGMGSFGDEGIRIPTEAERVFLASLASILASALDRVHSSQEKDRATEALHRREEEFRALVENSPDFVSRHDGEGRFLYCNPALLQLLDSNLADILGRTGPDLFPSARSTRLVQDHILECFHSRRSTELEFPDDTGHADPVPIHHVRVCPEFDRSGNVTSVLVIGRDVSLLHEAQRHLRTLVENLPDMIARFDTQGRHLWVSPSVVRAFAAEPSWFAGKSLLDVARPGLTDEVATNRRLHDSIVQTARDGVARRLDITWNLPGGRQYLEVRHIPERDASGNVVSVLSLTRDITEQTLAQGRARQLAALVESSQDAIVGKSLEGIVLSWNRGATSTYGYSEDEALGRHISFLIPPDCTEDVARILDSVRRGRPVERFETRRLAKDGRIIDVSLTISPILGDDGQIIGASTIARDITERLRNERELSQYRTRLEELVSARTADLEAANKELEGFSYSVSHDLRTPLRAIDGFSLMLARHSSTSLDDEGRRLLNVIRENTARMSQLIDDILAFSRSGRVEMRTASVDMDHLVETVWLELEPMRANRDVEFILHPLGKARGDLSMLRQVWTNLLANALKFSGPRPVARIEISRESLADGDWFIIKDNGVGFDPSYTHKLFGVFQRLHAVDEFEGTGIGLAIVQRIVARHGGRVMASGQVDHGATFRFSLPGEKT